MGIVTGIKLGKGGVGGDSGGGSSTAPALFKAVLRTYMKLYEQADKTGDNVTYSWLLEAPYKMRKELDAWKWIKGVGGRGCFVTRNLLAVLLTSRKYKLGKPVSNGTHDVHKVDLSEFKEGELGELTEAELKLYQEQT
jgi:hypothetical protein